MEHYKNILEGMYVDVCVLCGVVQRTIEPGENGRLGRANTTLSHAYTRERTRTEDRIHTVLFMSYSFYMIMVYAKRDDNNVTSTSDSKQHYRLECYTNNTKYDVK